MTTPTTAPPTGLAIHKVLTQSAFNDISSHSFRQEVGDSDELPADTQICKAGTSEQRRARRSALMLRAVLSLV